MKKTRIWLLSVLLASVIGFPAAAETDDVDPSDPVGPAARLAIQQILHSRRLEMAHTDTHSEIGRALRELRLALRELASTGGSTADSEAARTVRDRTADLKALLATARAEASGDQPAQRQLDRVASRIDRLAERTSQLGSAGSRAARRQSARALLVELESSRPRSERLEREPRRESGWMLMLEDEETR